MSMATRVKAAIMCVKHESWPAEITIDIDGHEAANLKEVLKGVRA